MSGLQRLSLAFALFALSSAASADRPKIGLALGGGGARGCAHAGILRVLEELHIPVDYIAGTSMGAAVGGMYASGMTADQIDRALSATDWREALSDRTAYKDLAYRRKEDEIRYLTALEAGLQGGHLVLPSGLRSGQKLRFLLQTYLIPVATVRDFSKLPIPFKAVAADIETGDAVILDHGDLAEAIQASASIPGIFSPITIDGKILVDGGIADNVPVDVVRAMGADIVIAVDVGAPLLKSDEIKSLLSVTGQVLTILTRKNAVGQIHAADVVLTPPLASFGLMAFEQAREIIDAGAKYGHEKVPQIAHLAVPPETFAALVAARPRPEAANRDIDMMVIQGSRRVDNRVIRAKIDTKPGKPIDPPTLRRDINRLYGLDDFQTVTFGLTDIGEQHTLVLNMKDKPWGPTYVRLGLNLEDDLKGGTSYNVAINVNRTRINRLGGEWRNDFYIGKNLGIVSEFYQPLDFSGRFFVAPAVQILRNTVAFYETSRQVTLFNLDQRGGLVDLGMQFEDWGELRAGVYRGKVKADVGAGTANIASGSIGTGGFQSTLTIARSDSPSIPTSGYEMQMRYLNSQQGMGATDAYSKFEGGGYTVHTWGRQSVMLGLSGGSNINTVIPAYDEFALGGLLNLSGFAPGQIRGQRYALFRLGTYTRIRMLPSQIGEGVYAGVFGEMGDAWTAQRNWHHSIMLITGADTVIGPVFLAYARGDSSVQRFYVAIGKRF